MVFTMHASRLGKFFSASKSPLALVSLRLIGAFSGMAVSLILTRSLGAEQYGYIAQAISLCMVLSICCTAGIEAGSAKFMIPAVVAENKSAETAYIKFSLFVLLAFSGALGLSTAIAIISVDLALSGLVILALLTAPLVGLSRILSGFSIGYSAIFAAVLPRSFMRPVFFLVLVFIANTLAGQVSPKQILQLFLLTVLTLCALQIWIVRKQFLKADINSNPQTHFDISRKTWLTHGALIGGAVLFVEFYQSLSVLLSSAVLGPEHVGLFDISLKLIGFVGFALVAINQTFLPRNAQAFAQQDFGALQNHLIQASFMRLIFGLIIISISILIGSKVLRIFGPEFVNAIPVFLTCLVIPVCMIIFGSSSQIISLWKSPETLVRLAAISLLCLICCVPLGAYIGEILGAAWGVNFAWLVWTAGGAFITKKHFGIDTTVFVFIRKRNQVIGA